MRVNKSNDYNNVLFYVMSNFWKPCSALNNKVYQLTKQINYRKSLFPVLPTVCLYGTKLKSEKNLCRYFVWKNREAFLNKWSRLVIPNYKPLFGRWLCKSAGGFGCCNIHNCRIKPLEGIIIKRKNRTSGCAKNRKTYLNSHRAFPVFSSMPRLVPCSISKMFHDAPVV